jgi:hypothetical protein
MKRWTSDNDGNMEPDDRPMSIPAVRRDSYVLAEEALTSIAQLEAELERSRAANAAAEAHARLQLEMGIRSGSSVENAEKQP